MAVSQGLLTLALLPTIRGKEKPALTTSLLTCLLLGVIAASLGTLGLWAASISAGVGSIAWGLLAAQRVHRKGGTSSG